MGQERRHFRDEFKTEALALLAGSGRRLVEIAGELGVSPSTLRNWRNCQGGRMRGRRCSRNRRRPCLALRTRRQRSPGFAARTIVLRMERDISGKAAALFSEAPR